MIMRRRDMAKARLYIAVLLTATLAAVGCAAMNNKAEEDYKAMVAAKPGNQLVGNKTCWECHMNDAHKGAGPGKVNCEDCHGPGELAISDLHEEKGRKACNYKTFIPVGKLSKAAQTAMCMNCHSQMATFALHNWNASAHSLGGVTCIDCHNVHHGGSLKPAKADIDKLCYNCHQEVQAQFMLPSHHPLPEGKITCTDCHNPHGSPNPGPMLVKDTVKETCARCHADKEGPFVFEHADVMEDCTICHFPHGGANDWLLVERQPFLCKQCHTPHRMGTTASLQRFGGNCTDCHSQIHGTDLNSISGGGGGFFVR